jgi:hypothetical protein
MHFANNSSQASVSKHGAPAQSVLRGLGVSNKGLRLRVWKPQPKGTDGPIQGPFVILDAGKNRHSATLEALLNRPTTSQEVLALIRKDHPACVNAVNANILVVEEQPAPTHPVVSDPDRARVAEPVGAMKSSTPHDVGTVSNPDF